ncbi:alpha/beta-hydrolase [Dichomitus squalens]|uniref:Alpha/beta-hydrolase n=1 Tax=Dichomitus squalens TaxID=114155 RepID=A0A4Q9M7K0_9APHY|nr:alpha/beta-hydrolase [Dichomitus squalens]
MQTVWFPVPVAALFRRIVNVVSAFSISHHYLHQPPSDSDVPRPGSYSLRWPAWPAYPQRLKSDEGLQRPRVGFLNMYAGSAEGTEVKDTPRTPPPTDSYDSWTPAQIHRLMHNPALYDPVRKPRYPIVLCHGLYGFDVRGPSSVPFLRQHYWSNVLNVLRGKLGAEVLVTGVPSTGSVSSRAENLDRFLRDKAPARGVNFLAHSMGGLDCRHLISHIKPSDYVPLSLTTIATPHRGSPFMDWCKQYLGLGRYRDESFRLGATEMQSDSPEARRSAAEREKEKEKATASVKSLLSLTSLPSSFTTLLLSVLDSPAYANLTTAYLNTVFNPHTPDDPSVKYFSVAGRTAGVGIWHPLWLPKMVLDGFEERERARMRETGDPRAEDDTLWGNDGLVTVQSAQWGEFLGTLEGCDHWEIRGARGLDVDLPSIPGPEEWKLGDWAKFVRAWKREEKKAAREAGAEISQQGHEAALAAARAAVGGEESERRERGDAGHKARRDSMNADEVVKSSTDKVSAVFDWIIESTPAKAALSPLASISSGSKAEEQDRDGQARKGEKERRAKGKSTKPAERHDLATKMDLERFYVALCKKLYDEGL